MPKMPKHPRKIPKWTRKIAEFCQIAPSPPLPHSQPIKKDLVKNDTPGNDTALPDPDLTNHNEDNSAAQIQDLVPTDAPGYDTAIPDPDQTTLNEFRYTANFDIFIDDYEDEVHELDDAVDNKAGPASINDPETVGNYKIDDYDEEKIDLYENNTVEEDFFKSANFNRKRKIVMSDSESSVSSDEEEEGEEEESDLDRSNQPGSSTSSSSDFDNSLLVDSTVGREQKNDDAVLNAAGPSNSCSHPIHGKLAPSKDLHDKRVVLLDFLLEVENDRKKKDDAKLERLKKEAKWGQQKGVKLKLGFIKTPARKNGIRGYFIILKGGTKYSLYKYYKYVMNTAYSDKKKQRNAKRSDPNDPFHQQIKGGMKKNSHDKRQATPQLDILYVAGLVAPEVMNKTDLVDTLKALVPVQLPGPNQQESNYLLYPGQWAGEGGYATMRLSHFNDYEAKRERQSAIYQRTKGASQFNKDAKYCVEIFNRMCDCHHTRITAEKFLIEFGRKWNEVNGIVRYIITPAAQVLPPDLHAIIDNYIRTGTSMFQFCEEEDHTSCPPYKRFWTLNELTSLPIIVHPKEVILRYDPTDPTFKSDWKKLKTIQELVDEYGEIPEFFHINKNRLANQLASTGVS